VCIFFSADFQCLAEMHLLIDEQWSNGKKVYLLTLKALKQLTSYGDPGIATILRPSLVIGNFYDFFRS